MQVGLTGALRSAADGQESIEVEADTIQELLTQVIERYPRIEHQLDEGIAVSIDGQIYRDSWGTRIPAGAEVFLLPRLAGG